MKMFIKKILSLVLVCSCVFFTTACDDNNETSGLDSNIPPILCTHSYTSLTTKEATCKETGIKTYTCTLCGNTYIEDIAKLTTHSYKSEVTKKATCKETGVKIYTCDICDDSYTEDIAKLSTHSYTSEITKESTCKETGVKTYTCGVCGDSYTEDIAKLSTHSYTSEITKESTCKETGVKTYTCGVCGDSYTEDIAKSTTHPYTSEVTKEATCKETGIKTYTCGVCGDSYAEEIAKLTTHSYNYEVTKEATCKETGLKTYTCSVCGDSYTNVIHKTNNHNWENATCSNAKTCSICNATSGGINTYAHTGDSECSNCGINYYNVLKNYVYLYGTQKTASSGGQYWLVEDYIYISGKSYKLSFEYNLNRVLCSIRYNDLWFNLSLEDSLGIYTYSYADMTGNTSDWLNGTLTAKNITKNTTELPYDDIDCLDGYHTNDYIQLKSCEYLKLLLRALNEFMDDEGLTIGTKHFGFTNFPSNGD